MANKPQSTLTGRTTFQVFNKEVEASDYLLLSSIEDIEFHFGQNAEDITLISLFGERIEGFYVDVGAFHPRKYSNTFLLHQFFGWRGINIDASKKAVALFEKERPDDINIHCAISRSRGKETFYKFDKPARNTLSKSVVNAQMDKGDVKIIGTEKVQTKTLQQILSNNLPKNQSIDLLNIDIEGFDLEALQSNDWSRFRPKVIAVEDHSVKKNGLDKSSVLGYLESKKYKFVSHVSTTSIYVDSKADLTAGVKRNYSDYLRSKIKQLEQSVPQTKNRSVILAQASKKTMSGKQLKELQNQNMQLANKLKWIEPNLKAVKDEKQVIEDKYNSILQSGFWRYTEPLRKVLQILRRK